MRSGPCPSRKTAGSRQPALSLSVPPRETDGASTGPSGSASTERFTMPAWTRRTIGRGPSHDGRGRTSPPRASDPRGSGGAQASRRRGGRRGRRRPTREGASCDRWREPAKLHFGRSRETGRLLSSGQIGMGRSIGCVAPTNPGVCSPRFAGPPDPQRLAGAGTRCLGQFG
jgi:hypothetical protein